MGHERHYTVEQANAVRGWVAARVALIQDAHARLVALGNRATEALEALDSQAGGSYPGRDVARCLVELSRGIGELEAVGVVLRDVDRGLVDFPSLRDGQEVYLCWLIEEDSVAFWHELHTGFAGRQPL